MEHFHCSLPYNYLLKEIITSKHAALAFSTLSSLEQYTKEITFGMKFLICMYMTYKAAVFLPRILMYFHSSWALNSQMRCFYHECKEMVQGGQKCNGQINWIHNDAYRPIQVCTPLVIQQATLVRRFHLYSWHCHYQKLSQHYVGKKLLQRNTLQPYQACEFHFR